MWNLKKLVSEKFRIVVIRVWGEEEEGGMGKVEQETGVWALHSRGTVENSSVLHNSKS
jgi:hypothetical protein